MRVWQQQAGSNQRDQTPLPLLFFTGNQDQPTPIVSHCSTQHTACLAGRATACLRICAPPPSSHFTALLHSKTSANHHHPLSCSTHPRTMSARYSSSLLARMLLCPSNLNRSLEYVSMKPVVAAPARNTGWRRTFSMKGMLVLMPRIWATGGGREGQDARRPETTGAQGGELRDLMPGSQEGSRKKWHLVCVRACVRVPPGARHCVRNQPQIAIKSISSSQHPQHATPHTPTLHPPTQTLPLKPTHHAPPPSRISNTITATPRTGHTHLELLQCAGHALHSLVKGGGARNNLGQQGVIELAYNIAWQPRQVMAAAAATSASGGHTKHHHEEEQ